MAGLAAGFGGAGQALGQVNQQIRPILEARREGYSQLLSQQAQSEANPAYRNQLLDLSLRTRSGEDLSKIIKDSAALHQKMMVDEQAAQALHQSLGGSTTQAKPTPSTGSGISGGITAAQPTTSPVSPESQTGAFSKMLGLQNPIPGSPQTQPPSNNQGGGPNIGGGPGVQATNQGIPPVTVTPQATTPTLPTAEDPQNIVNKYLQDPRWQAPANRALMQQAMNQELAHNEAVRQKQEELALGPQRIHMLTSPETQAYADKLRQSGYPDIMIPSMVSAALGINVPSMGYGMASAMFNPFDEEVNAEQLEAQYPGILARFNVNPKQTPTVMVSRNKIAGPGSYPTNVAGRTPGFVTATTSTGTQEITPKVPGPINTSQGPAVVSSQLTPHNVSMNTGQQGYYRGLNPLNVQALPGTQNPAYAPTVHETIQNVAGYDTQGRPATLRVPTTSTTQKVPSASPTGTIPPVQPPSGNLVVPPQNGFPGMGIPESFNSQGSSPSRSGGIQAIEKPLTPLQQTDMEKQVGVFDQTLKRATYVRDHVGILNSMIDGGKIALSVSPSTGALMISRLVGLTEDEKKFAAEFQALSEDINALRSLKGFAGFRGPEAFEALMSQRGRLMADPSITRGVLNNTIDTIISQRDPMAATLHKPKYDTGMINVQIPGTAPGQIHKSQLDAFKKLHPDVKVLQ